MQIHKNPGRAQLYVSFPPPSLFAGPSGPVLTPYKQNMCRHWVEVTGQSPPGTGDERGGHSSQGSMSHLRDSLAGPRHGTAHCCRTPGHSPSATVDRGWGGWVPGEKLSSSIQMRIVPPTLPGLQGPPLEPLRSQNPHLRKWGPLSQGPPAQTFPGLCGF